MVGWLLERNSEYRCSSGFRVLDDVEWLGILPVKSWLMPPRLKLVDPKVVCSSYLRFCRRYLKMYFVQGKSFQQIKLKVSDFGRHLGQRKGPPWLRINGWEQSRVATISIKQI